MGTAAKLRVNARHRLCLGRLAQVSQRQARADAEAGVFGGEFHSRAGHLFRAGTEDEFHKNFSPPTG